MSEINQYIDFNKLWKDVVDEWKTSLDCIEDQRIAGFINLSEHIPLQTSECTFDDPIVLFCFAEVTEKANESNNQESWFCIYITYNIVHDEFVDYMTEQG